MTILSIFLLAAGILGILANNWAGRILEPVDKITIKIKRRS